MRIRTLGFAMLPMVLAAQDATEKELLDLLNTPLTVASAKALTVRESPGVISTITREEIQAIGARDLIDVLRMVPGLDFAYDTQGAVGLSVRGLWAYEGKALLLWNGVEMPELLYGNTLFGHHYPVDQIKRIEVIRGPGSALYGGLAELAVIKVTTLGPDDLAEGGAAGAMVGRGEHQTLRSLGQFMSTSHIGEGTFTLGASYEEGARSDTMATLSGGTRVDTSDRSAIYSKFLHAGYVLGGFQATLVVDDYLLGGPNALDDSGLPAPQQTSFTSQNLDVRYETKLGDVKITPKVVYRSMTPWDVWDGTSWHPRRIQDVRYGVDFGWEPTKSLILSGGVERETQDASVGANAPAGYHLTGTGVDSVNYNISSAFLQAEYSGVVNLTVGGRYENHSVAGSDFVPRAALTKVVDKWHFKILFANAFRTPNIGNEARPVIQGGSVDAEKTRTIEAEAGRQIGPAILTLNVFDTRLEKPLVWRNLGNSAGYSNGDPISTRGVELDFKLRQSWGFLNASYAQHQAVDKGVTDWLAQGHDSSFLGVADQKLSVLASIKLAEGWSFSPSAIYLGDRYGYDWETSANNLVLKKFKADLLLNATVTFTHQAWTASLGVFDALSAKPAFLQAYPSDVPLQGPSREIVLKLKYGF
jgi:outer membrane cobalamin receptor